MKKEPSPKLGKFQLTARADAPDFRDYTYEPALIRLRSKLDVPDDLLIRNQGKEPACTGFGLAAVIDRQIRESGRSTSVSARMLYEMARRYDEWAGEKHEGSSCRGAIKGWYNMGVCEESLYSYAGGKTSGYTVTAAKNARSNTIGAYYRLGKRISDYHAAMGEVGAIFCSAVVHEGWTRPEKGTGKIRMQAKTDGAHAFAIVGYDNRGFWIQNSWGASWGKNGTALWTYEDWLENVQDAWVFRLALPTPQIWHLPSQSGKNLNTAERFPKPTRAEIAGHFVHIDDGQFHDDGHYWSNLEDVRLTTEHLTNSTKYDHLLFYAHGGLNSPEDDARRLAAMKETFKENRIYPYHLMYDTGILEELKDVLIGRRKAAEERAGGLSDWLDKMVEKTTRVPGRALWREMKAGAELPFESENAGAQTLAAFVQAFQNMAKPLQIHLAGHSTGMILLAYLLRRLQAVAPTLSIGSVSLLAPAGTIDLFTSHLQPLLKAEPGSFRVADMAIYNLTDDVEQDDEVTFAYNKSLLYLVSRAFEEEIEERILGMQKYSVLIERRNLPHLEIHYSKGNVPGARVTASSTHGGFDNDPLTMNHVLRRILKKKPVKEFTRESLDY